MKQSLDHYLNLLRDYDPLTEAQHAAIDARVRRDVLARFGGFSVPLHAASSFQLPASSRAESTTLRTGMLVLLRRPAFAFAAVAAVVVGVGVAVQRSGWGSLRTQGLRQPVVAPPAEVVAVATPIVPGSGFAVSVFGLSPASSLQLPAASINPAPTRRVRRAGRPINPAPGVFDQWGESVFTDEEYLRAGREGKNVFNS